MSNLESKGFPVEVDGETVLISHKETPDPTRAEQSEVLVGMDGTRYTKTGAGRVKRIEEAAAAPAVAEEAPAEEPEAPAEEVSA